MIHFITGEVNQGKSTHLYQIYQRLQRGDGFYNRKIYEGERMVGQDIVHFATGKSQPFAFREGFIPDNWHEACRYATFSFSREGLRFGRRIIHHALRYQIHPLFIDEIGPLELAGQGFSQIFGELVVAKVEAYVVVRQSCLESVIDRFNITECSVVGFV